MNLRFGRGYLDRLDYGQPVPGTLNTKDHVIALALDDDSLKEAKTLGLVAHSPVLEFTRREQEYESLGEDVFYAEHRVNGQILEKELSGPGAQNHTAGQKVRFLVNHLSQLPLSPKARSIFVEPLIALANQRRINLSA